MGSRRQAFHGEVLERRALLSASISGSVYNDVDQNGALDAGESGVNSWQVFLDLNNDGVRNSGEVSIFTSPSGAYSFSNLNAGDYRIRAVQQEWWKAVKPTSDFLDVHLAEGQNLAGQNFFEANVYTAGRNVSGTVFEDLNGNDRIDSLEGGMADVKVYGDVNRNHAFDAGEPNTMSYGYGSYWMSDLPDGSYPFYAVPPAGWTQVGGSGYDFPTPPGSVSANVILKRIGAAVTGTVYNDVNGNGKRDIGDSGLYAHIVYDDVNNNNKLDAGERSTGTQTGFYNLTGLAAGTHEIRQVLPSGWTQTTPANNYGWALTLSSNQSVTGKDFGTRQGTTPVSGSIAGTVWNDLDGDGVRDSSEPGVAAVTLYNDANNNSKLDAGENTTISNSNGNYLLSSLGGGTYKIRQVLQSGWSQTSPANGYGWTITLASNQSMTAKDFGTKQSTTSVTGGKISGTVFNDLDGDGVKDSNEVGVGSGWKVYIDLDNDSIWDANEVYTITDSSGNWTLSNLAAGTHKVRQVLLSGWKQTTPSNNYGLNVTLAANRAASGKLFGSKKLT